MRQKRNQGGFTLMELLLTMVTGALVTTAAITAIIRY